MRKFLLASVATLGTGGLMGGAAFAQAPAGTPTQGQVAYPMASPLASANTNNNYQAPALPGALANPTPGTIVVHVNGKVQTTFQSEWTNGDTHQIIAPASSVLVAGNTTVAPAESPDQKVLDIYRNNVKRCCRSERRDAGLATVYRRGRVYWVRFRANGHHIRRSSHSSRRQKH